MDDIRSRSSRVQSSTGLQHTVKSHLAPDPFVISVNKESLFESPLNFSLPYMTEISVVIRQ